MLILPNNFGKAFERIKRTSLSHSTCKLVLFVSSLDVDAICASKMLSILLKRHLIVYQLIPVVGYSDLRTKYMKLDDSITNVLLIGCGSMVDLESFLDIDESELIETEHHNHLGAPITPDSSSESIGERLRKHIYIIDGHRPWNLDNLFGSHVINCFDDGSAGTELESEKLAYNLLVSIQNEEEIAESNEENSNQPKVTKDSAAHPDFDDFASSDEEGESRRNNRRGLDSDDDEDQDDEDERLLNDSSRKRRYSDSDDSPTERRKRLILENEKTIEKYYNQGTTVSTSVALQIYSLISALGETNIDYLWLAIVGSISLSASFAEMYGNIVPVLKEEVNRLEDTSLSQNNHGEPEGRGRNADDTKLTVAKDYPLFLMRHWNLYNSFFYSNYVNARYQLYTADGSKKLKTLFAKMGIPIAAANQNWHYLDINVKKKLHTLFKKNLKSEKFRGFFKDGFFRQFGFHGSVSANDYVEAMSALLEYDGDVTSGFNAKGKPKSSRLNTPESDGKDDAVDEEDESHQMIKSINKRENQFIANFWKSYDSLSNIDSILKGLQVSKLQQKFIFDKGFEIFQKKLMKDLRVFRLVVLKDEFGTNNSTLHNSQNRQDINDGLEITTLSSNTRMFQNPLILKKLGNWILDSCAELASSKPLPLVIASFDPETNTYMVIGLPPKYPSDLQDDLSLKERFTVLNTFSYAFQEVANMTNTRNRIDSFESCIIEVKKEDLSSFLEKLSLSGLV